jgi:hypothetical protein
MINSDLHGIQLTPDFVQILLLLFADDVALTADTVNGLQRQLNLLHKYCNDWNLSVNTAKTKILVFKNGGRLSRFESWTYNNELLEAVPGFSYVGVYFTSKLSFYKMSEHMACKAKKVLVALLSSLNHLMPMSRKIYFKLFDAKIAPILLYGSELWGLDYMYDIEKVHLYACKRFMCAPQRACNAAVLGDCERYPMHILTSRRCIKFWLRLLNMPSCRYVRKCYDMLLYYDSIGYNNWASKVKLHLYMNGYGFVWENQYVDNHRSFLYNYTLRLKDQYIQRWSEECSNNSKLGCYTSFKSVFEFEKYLDIIDVKKYRFFISAFRTSSHSLMIEKGRHIGLDRESRTCFQCISCIEDEYHFILVCPIYRTLREVYISKKYYENPTINKFNILMASKNEQTMKNLALFIYHGFMLRSTYI